MACFLALETGGRLLRETGDGALLLEYCANDNAGGGGKVTATPNRSRNNPDANSFERSKAEYYERQRELQEKQRKTEVELKAKQAEIDLLEARRAEQLANQVMQIELVTMLRQMAALEAERAELSRLLLLYRREEEDIYVLLMCMGL